MSVKFKKEESAEKSSIREKRLDDLMAISAIETETRKLMSQVGVNGEIEVRMDDPAVLAAIDGKRGASAAYIASIVSALISYEQSCGWRHLIAALSLLIKFIRWARKNDKNDKEQ